MRRKKWMSNRNDLRVQWPGINSNFSDCFSVCLETKIKLISVWSKGEKKV